MGADRLSTYLRGNSLPTNLKWDGLLFTYLRRNCMPTYTKGNGLSLKGNGFLSTYLEEDGLSSYLGRDTLFISMSKRNEVFIYPKGLFYYHIQKGMAFLPILEDIERLTYLSNMR